MMQRLVELESRVLLLNGSAASEHREILRNGGLLNDLLHPPSGQLKLKYSRPLSSNTPSSRRIKHLLQISSPKTTEKSQDRHMRGSPPPLRELSLLNLSRLLSVLLNSVLLSSLSSVLNYLSFPKK